MTTNVVKVIYDGQAEIISRKLTQWDYGQVLLIEGDLPADYVVDFANEGDTLTRTEPGDPEGVPIPDRLLQAGRNVLAYVRIFDGTSGNTVCKITIPVERRAERMD